MNAGRIESLTLLRFVAAFIVVVFHFGRSTGLANVARPAIISGPQMVTFFFVISGFVLMVAYYSRNVSSGAFYLARFARIAPAYFVALIMFCFLNDSWRESNLTAIVLHLAFLQSWAPSYPVTLNGPDWSLSVEAFLYFCFPFLLMSIKHLRMATGTLLAFSGAVWCATNIGLTYLLNADCSFGPRSACQDIVTEFPLSHFCSFLLGVAGGYMFLSRGEQTPSARRTSLALVVSIALIWFLLEFPHLYLGRLPFKMPVESSFYAPAFLALILSVAYSRNVLTRALAWPPLVLLGEVSYALYIFQVPVHKAYERFVGKRFELSKDYDFYAYLLMLVCLCIVSLYVIERPGQKLILLLGRRLATSWRSFAERDESPAEVATKRAGTIAGADERERRPLPRIT